MEGLLAGRIAEANGGRTKAGLVPLSRGMNFFGKIRTVNRCVAG
jgi:hypothetical protein